MKRFPEEDRQARREYPFGISPEKQQSCQNAVPDLIEKLRDLHGLCHQSRHTAFNCIKLKQVDAGQLLAKRWKRD
jgi:hypothetical protein